MNTRPSLRSIFWGRNSFDFMTAAAKGLPRLGGALATVAATRLTALRALRFKYSKLVEPNFAVALRVDIAPAACALANGGPRRASIRVTNLQRVQTAVCPFFVIGQTIIGVIEPMACLEPAPVEVGPLAVESGFAGFKIASCNACCWAYGLLSFARRLAS